MAKTRIDEAVKEYEKFINRINSYVNVRDGYAVENQHIIGQQIRADIARFPFNGLRQVLKKYADRYKI